MGGECTPSRRGADPLSTTHRGSHTHRVSAQASIEDDNAGVARRMLCLIIVMILLIAALPTWPYNAGWGDYPGGILGLMLIIVIVLLLLGRL